VGRILNENNIFPILISEIVMKKYVTNSDIDGHRIKTEIKLNRAKKYKNIKS
jgi:hypothetical protein